MGIRHLWFTNRRLPALTLKFQSSKVPKSQRDRAGRAGSFGTLLLWNFALFFLALWIGLLAQPTLGLSGSPADKNWPCVQRKVPEISPGMIWVGPPFDELAGKWFKDAEVAMLVEAISSRRTPLEKGKRQVVEFAQQLGSGRDHRLTLVASGMLETINLERNRIIGKIEKFTVAQRKLGDRMETLELKLRAFPRKMTAEQQEEYEDLLSKRNWFKRLFEQREQSLSYICERPVLLEQRAFAMGRELMQHLEVKTNP